MTPPRVVVALLMFLPLGCSLAVNAERSLIARAGPSTVSRDGAPTAAEQEELYRADVSDYTYNYVDADGAVLDFEGGLGQIAERHGVPDWDAADATYLAIGAGLALAQVNSHDLDAFKRTLGRSDPLRMAEIQRGFDRRR